jgi:hypothetical protein
MTAIAPVTLSGAPREATAEASHVATRSAIGGCANEAPPRLVLVFDADLCLRARLDDAEVRRGRSYACEAQACRVEERAVLSFRALTSAEQHQPVHVVPTPHQRVGGHAARVGLDRTACCLGAGPSRRSARGRRAPSPGDTCVGCGGRLRDTNRPPQSPSTSATDTSASAHHGSLDARLMSSKHRSRGYRMPSSAGRRCARWPDAAQRREREVASHASGVGPGCYTPVGRPAIEPFASRA